MTLKKIIRLWALTFVAIIFSAGYFYHILLWDSFLEDALHKATLHNQIVAGHIDAHLDDQQKSVVVVSRTPAWQEALTKLDPQSFQQANAFLDFYQQTFGASATFLLDYEGNTIASSNRQSANSFIGHNYSFRPYFQSSMQGTPAIYFAYGMTSKLAGIYYSAPVLGSNSNLPLGVLVMKGDVSPWQEEMQGDDPNDITTLADPQGVIFLSSRKNWAGRTLWKIAPETQKEILKTKQFGDSTLAWSGLVRLDEQHAIDETGERFIVHERELSKYPGWQVVCLENEKGLSLQYFASLWKYIGRVIIPIGTLLGLLVYMLYRKATHEFNTRKLTEDKLQTITNTANDAIVMLDNNGHITFWNHAAHTIFGYTQAEVLGKDLHSFLTPPQYRQAHAENFPHFVKTGQGSAIGHTVELHSLTKSGKEIPIELSLSAVELVGKWHAVGIVRDISQRKLAEEALLESENRFRGSFESAAIGMALVGLEGQFLKVNNSLCSMVGYAEPELLTLRFQDITHADDLEPDFAFVQQMIAGTIDKYQMQKRYIHKLGHTIWVQLAVSLVRDARGLPLYFVSQIADITEQKQALEKIVRLAHYDALTGIPNRALFLDRLSQSIVRARRQGKFFALLFLDLDGFKAINDTLGHEQGDALLREVASRLQGTVRTSDTVARMGGDEFTIILENIAGAQDAAPVAEKIVATLGHPFELHGKICTIGASVGIALYPQDGRDANALVNHADKAMYKVKAGGKSGYSYWREG